MHLGKGLFGILMLASSVGAQGRRIGAEEIAFGARASHELLIWGYQISMDTTRRIFCNALIYAKKEGKYICSVGLITTYINKQRITNDKKMHSTNQHVPGNHRNTEMEKLRKRPGEYGDISHPSSAAPLLEGRSEGGKAGCHHASTLGWGSHRQQGSSSLAGRRIFQWIFE